MATATASITLSSTAYTALAAAGTGSVMVTPVQFGAQIAIATSAPSLTSADWFPVAPGDELILRGLGASDIVYALPSGGASSDPTRIVKVITQ